MRNSKLSVLSKKQSLAVDRQLELEVHQKVVQKSLQKFINKVINALRESLSKNTVSEWFSNVVLRYSDPNIQKLKILEKGVSLIVQQSKQPKILNQIFLEIDGLNTLISKCQDFIQLGFILKQHQSCKVKKKQVFYDTLIIDSVKQRVQQLVDLNNSKIDKLFRITHVNTFLETKKFSPDSSFPLEYHQRINNHREVVLIFKYIFRPLFEQKTLSKIYSQLVQIVKWLIIIDDSQIEEQQIIVQISKKINNFLMIRKTMDNYCFIKIVNTIYQLSSVKYLKDDPFNYANLAAICNKLSTNEIPYKQIINNWILDKNNNKQKSKKIQLIFRNLIATGSMVFAFYTIDNFSNHLKTLRDYETLYYLFDTFIRKQFLSIRLKNKTFVKYYLSIIILYTVGFINRDRLDGETQLDRLTDNLQTLLFCKQISYDGNYRELILFYRIYENRFNCLTSSAKRFVRNLEQHYRYSPSSQQIYQHIEQYIFKEMSLDYNDDDLHILQRSQRYVGMENLGNTCYMNSFMQALFMTKKFKTLIVKAKNNGEIQSSRNYFHTLARLFKDLDEKGYIKKYEINPIYFKQKIPQPFCSSWEQHDSGQFGRLYFDTIVSQIKDTDLCDKLQKIFTHKIKHQMICQKCGYERYKTENIFDFIIHFDEKVKQVNISEFMKNNFGSYELKNQDALYCDRCKFRTPSLRITSPLEFASHLIVTFSIFKFQGQQSSKMTTPMNLQFVLNTRTLFPTYQVDNITYQLYAFIVHIGTGVQRGHYKCFARNLQENPMIWYQFDDHFVTQREISKYEDFRFGQKQNPYILFYCQNKKGHRISISSPTK